MKNNHSAVTKLLNRIIAIFLCVLFIGGCSLHHAVSHNDLASVKKAVDSGADVNKSKLGWTPLMYAAYYGYLRMTEYLIQEGADLDIQLRGETYNPYFEGFTALHFAAYYGRTKIAKTLIDSGADLNLKDKNDSTAYDYAREYEFTDIMEYIKKAK